MHLDILSFGESLLNGLVARRQEDPDRSLLFVVHSLGGLVLKDVRKSECWPFSYLIGIRRCDEQEARTILDSKPSIAPLKE